MSTPTFNRNVKNIKGFSEGVIMIAENDDSGEVVGDVVQFEFAKESTINQEVEEIVERDDTGKPVVTYETVTSVTMEGMILSRDESVRKCYIESDGQAFKGKRFTVWIIGALLDDNGTEKREVWIFHDVVFSSAFTYGIGTSEAKMPYKFTANARKGTDVTISMPTGDAWTELITSTGDITIGVGDYFYSADLV